MDMSFEEQIRERAYHIWQAGGMADGQAHEHWVCAEQAVRGEAAAVAAEPEVILTKPRTAPAKASKSASAKSKAKTAEFLAPKTRAARAKKLAASAQTAH